MALKKLFDVPITRLWRHLWNRFVNKCHDFRTIFWLLTSFFSTWCFWLPVTRDQTSWHSISFRLMWPLHGLLVTTQSCVLKIWHDFRKIFSLLASLSAWCIWLRVIKWLGIQLVFIWCAHYVVMTSFVTSQNHFQTSVTWFS